MLPVNVVVELPPVDDFCRSMPRSAHDVVSNAVAALSGVLLYGPCRLLFVPNVSRPYFGVGSEMPPLPPTTVPLVESGLHWTSTAGELPLAGVVASDEYA